MSPNRLEDWPIGKLQAFCTLTSSELVIHPVPDADRTRIGLVAR